MSGVVCQLGQGYSAAAPTEKQMVMRRKGLPLDGTHPAILCIHGHGGDAGFMVPSGNPGWTNIGFHAWRLALEGYIVVSIDAAGATAWTDAAEMARMDDAYNYVMGLGAKAGKIGLTAWSMGGAACLNWIKRNPAKVGAAWLFSPASDLDFFNATAGYVPSYSTGGVALGAYASELAADFNPYSTASAGYRIHDEPASWRGIGVPITLAHALDDATIPVGQTQSFVTAVNDPLVTYREVATGGHAGGFSVPGLEVGQFFRQHLPVPT